MQQPESDDSGFEVDLFTFAQNVQGVQRVEVDALRHCKTCGVAALAAIERPVGQGSLARVEAHDAVQLVQKLVETEVFRCLRGSHLGGECGAAQHCVGQRCAEVSDRVG